MNIETVNVFLWYWVVFNTEALLNNCFIEGNCSDSDPSDSSLDISGGSGSLRLRITKEGSCESGYYKKYRIKL